MTGSSAVPSLDLTPIRLPFDEYAARIEDAVNAGGRLGIMSARKVADSELPALIALTLDPQAGRAQLWEALPPGPDGHFPSLTPTVSQVHWFERQIYDLFGLRPGGHPRFKSVILHEAWPADFHPLRNRGPTHIDKSAPRRTYAFMKVHGEGVYEIPVGPIHAGIIEPGHFRFSCMGEVIQNLEIRLGYQHRGVERRLTEIPWKRARFLAEAASSDTSVGNACAHAMAIEQIVGVEPPILAQQLRALALEIERAASHIGDLGGICSDIGFAAGAATFGTLRGVALGLGDRLTGSRFLTAFILPGGVARPLHSALRTDILSQAERLASDFERAAPVLMENPGALDRMDGIGRVRPSLARDFGLVGPSGRASGSTYDVREAFRQAPYLNLPLRIPSADEGDVLARVRMRVEEVRVSLAMIRSLLEELRHEGEFRSAMPDVLPPDRVGLGIVEAWRGELIHLVFTGEDGRISRCCIKDPSFNNWTGLAIAARGQVVSDFPLCNKSFSLSYSGNDL